MRQLVLSLSVPHHPTFGNFVGSEENAQALDWLNLWPHWPLSHVVIHGEAGCGKTHLARAFADRTQGIYVGGKQHNRPSPDQLFHEKKRVLIIDDYDLIDQEDWLFHVHNMAQEQGTSIVYLGKKAPSHQNFSLADLRSRLRSLHSIAIQYPEEDFFKRLLAVKLANQGLPCPEEVPPYLFRRLERSYEAMDHLIERVNLVTLEQQRPLTVPLLREILGDQEREGEVEEEF